MVDLYDPSLYLKKDDEEDLYNPSLYTAPEPVEPEPARETGSFGQDVVAAWGKGSNSLLEGIGTMYGLATGDMDNWARNQGKSGAEYYEGMESTELKALQEKSQQAVDSADNEWSKAGTALWHTIKSPRLLTDLLVTSMPMLAVGGAVGRGIGGTVNYLGKGSGLATRAGNAATGATYGAMGAIQGADVAGQFYDDNINLPDQIWNENPDYIELSNSVGSNQAKEQIATDSARKVFAIATGISIATQKTVPGGAVLEKMLAGKKSGLTGGFIARSAKGALGEGTQEVAEEAGGQLASNLVTQADINPKQETFEGVGQAAGTAFPAGAAFGLVGGMLSPEVKSIEDNKNVINDALKNMNKRQTIDEKEAVKQEINTIQPATVNFDTETEMKPVDVSLDETAPGNQAEIPGNQAEIEQIKQPEAQPVQPPADGETRKVNSKGNLWKRKANAELEIRRKKLGDDWVPVQEDEGWALHHKSIIKTEQPVTEQSGDKENTGPTPKIGNTDFSPTENQNMPTGEEIAQAAKEGLSTHSENDLKKPTLPQIKADNYKKIPVKYDGLDIKIETAAGEKRKPEWPSLKHHYGDIKRTEAADGDALDVFINKDNERTDTPVFIINQTNKDGTFDEHKIMLGFNTEAEARQGYLDNYEKGWKAPDVIPQLTMPALKEWLKNGDTKKEYTGNALTPEEEVEATIQADKTHKRSEEQIKRIKQNLQPDSRNDDMATFIRKSGGIDTNKFTDQGGRLSHLDKENTMFGLPKIEQPGKGLDQDTLTELLTSAGYMRPDQNIDDVLFDMEGKEVFSMENEGWMQAEADKYNEAYEEEHGSLDAQYEQDTDYEPLLTDYTPEKPDLMAELVAQANQIIDRQIKKGDLSNEYALEEILSERVTDAQALKNVINFITEQSNGKQVTPGAQSENENGATEESQKDETQQSEKDAERADQAENQELIPKTDEEIKKQELADAEKEKDTKRDGKDQSEPDSAISGNDMFANDGKLEPDLFAPESRPDQETKPPKSKLDETADSIDAEIESLSQELADLFKKNSGTLNAGVDPEILAVGSKLGALYIAKGAVTFAQYGRAIIDQMKKYGIDSNRVKPVLKELYGASQMSVSDELFGQMDDAKTVRGFDLDSFDKPIKEKPVKKPKKPNAKQNETEKTPAKTEAVKEITARLDKTKVDDGGEYTPLNGLYLEADTGTEIISDTADNWLKAIDDRLEAVNKLRGCL